MAARAIVIATALRVEDADIDIINLHCVGALSDKSTGQAQSFSIDVVLLPSDGLAAIQAKIAAEARRQVLDQFGITIPASKVAIPTFQLA